MSTSRGLACLLFTAVVLSSLSFAATPDRITGDLASGLKVQIGGNLQRLVRPENDLGRADSSRMIERLSLDFRLSPAQQRDLDQFLAELGDRTSPNFHKYLTIPQYARHFGMSQNDINKVVAWLESEGFTNIKVVPTRRSVKFDGTVAQIESTFALEMHYYLANGEVHLANAKIPSVPAALSGVVMHVGHLHDFAPKPHLKVRPNLTSYVSGNHFLTPADFATIYDLNGLYAAGATGSGQKIVIVGQTTVSTTDLNNFRSAAGLTASTVNIPPPMEGTATRCSGDEGESDLDIEWSGAVAKDAQITFLFAGLGSGDTCSARHDSVWDALEDALTGTTTGTAGSPIAPFVSTSYGFCEQGLQSQDPGFAAAVQTWVQTGQTLGVTLTSASGDAGAADCDDSRETSATQGLAVDVPASIPETTGAGGNEFTGDAAGTVTGTPPNTKAGATQYWAASGTGSDVVSTAISYIPEEAWNDTTLNIANGGGLGASGGGESTLFSKPTWQNVAPSGTMRFVPDISLSASADHDGYLFCSEDAGAGTCTSGFRTGAGGSFTVVGGTSAVAPTFTAIMALINQFVGNTPPKGLAPINPMLYSLYADNSTSGAFNDITSGNNIVPCTSGTPNCPTTAPLQYGFTTNAGYDEVTGLGSVNAFNLAKAWSATLTSYSFSLSSNLSGGSLALTQGQSGTVNITLASSSTPPFIISSGSGQQTAMPVTYACSGLPSESTCMFSASDVPSGQQITSSATAITLVVQTTAPTAELRRPFDRGSRIFYAVLLPGLLGIVVTVGSRKRSLGRMRTLGLIVVLGASTLWLGSCGGSSSSGNKNPGTPVGNYPVTVNATTSGGPSSSLQFSLDVTQ